LYRALELDAKSPRWKATFLNSLAGCLAKEGRLEAAEAEYQEILLRYGQERDEHGRPFGLIVAAQLGEIQIRRNRPALAITNELKLFQELLNDRWLLSWEDEQFFARRLEERLTVWQPQMGASERQRFDLLQGQWRKRQSVAVAAKAFMAKRWPVIQNTIRHDSAAWRPLLWLDPDRPQQGLWILPSFDASTGQRRRLVLAEISCQDLWKRMAETLDPLAAASQSAYRL